MRVRPTFVAAVAIIALSASLLSPVPAQAEVTHKTATVHVIVTAPKAVAATVVLKKIGAKSRTAIAKKSNIKSFAHDVKVAPGAWELSAPTVLVKGVLYGPKHASTRVNLKAGKATRLVVTYKALAGPRNLKAANLTSSKVQLTWTGSRSKNVTYVVRRTMGDTVPASHTRGASVKVNKLTATATGLKPNTKYTFAVFERVGGKWTAPITLVAHTAPASGKAGATYVTTAGTTILAPSSAAANSASATGTGISLSLPSTSALPSMGAAIVIPATSRLPGGFVGTVTSISASGEIGLTSAPLSAAFSNLNIEVPTFSSTQPGATSSASSPDKAPSSPIQCTATVGGASITLANTLTPTISGSASIRLDGTSAVIDANIVVRATDSWTASAAGEVSGTCHLGPHDFFQQIAAAPVPIGLKYEAGVNATLKFEAEANKISSTRSFTNAYTLHSVISLTSGITGGVTHTQSASADAPTSEKTANAEVDLSVEGALTFGPAVGTDFAGAIAGVELDLVPLRLAASVAFAAGEPAACWSLDLQWELKAGINAEAWAGWAKVSFEVTLLDVKGSYLPTPIRLPTGCPPPAPAPATTGAAGPSGSATSMDIQLVADPISPSTSEVGSTAKFHIRLTNTSKQPYWPGLASGCPGQLSLFTWGSTGRAPRDTGYIDPGDVWVWDCFHTVTQTDIDRGYYVESVSMFGSSDPSNAANTVILPLQTASIQVAVPVQTLTLGVTGVATSRYTSEWTITLTNTGKESVTPRSVTSSICGTVSVSPSVLKPGDSVSTSCSATVAESQLMMNTLTNSLTAVAYGVASGTQYSTMLSSQVNV